MGRNFKTGTLPSDCRAPSHSPGCKPASTQDVCILQVDLEKQPFQALCSYLYVAIEAQPTTSHSELAYAFLLCKSVFVLRQSFNPLKTQSIAQLIAIHCSSFFPGPEEGKPL